MRQRMGYLGQRLLIATDKVWRDGQERKLDICSNATTLCRNLQKGI
jgi:hypothetical protein